MKKKDAQFQVLNKSHIKRHFQDAVQTYDHSAVAQRKAGNRLLEIVDTLQPQPRVIIDIGCGTGHDSLGLSRQFPEALIIPLDLSIKMLLNARVLDKRFEDCSKPLCADAENLPLRVSSIDLLFSNSAFNWFNDLASALKSYNEILKPEGKLLFSLFGPDTLREIRDAWRETDSRDTHVNTFLPAEEIKNMLSCAGFRLAKAESVKRPQYFDTPRGALDSFRNVGGKNALIGRQKGMTGKKTFAQFLENLEKRRSERGIPLTYEILSFFAHK